MEDVAIPMDIRQRVRLCFYEAVTNAVKHGNKFDESKKVYIQRQLDSHKLIFKIQDEGEGFDLSKIESPLQSENIEKTSGRGVYLVQELASACQYCPKTKTMTIEFGL